jgi:hypothetical protein
MPQYQDPAAADALRYLRQRTDSLQKQVDSLKAGRGSVALQRGDHVNVPAPHEGQVMVDYVSDVPYHFSRQQWRAFSEPVEYWTGNSDTDWGTSYTVLDLNESINWGDFITPTFLLNGSSNLEIGKDGAYHLNALFRGQNDSASVSTVRFLEVKVISGPTPDTIGNGLSGSHYSVAPTRIFDQPGGTVDVLDSRWPAHSDWLLFIPGSMVGAGAPCELRFRAYKEEDEVGVAETTGSVDISVIRVGPVWS